MHGITRAILATTLTATAGPVAAGVGSGVDQIFLVATPPPTPATIVEPEVATPVPSPFKVVRGTPGYWQLVQDLKGVWWLRSPDGRLEFQNTVTTVQPYQKGRDPDGAYFTSRDYAGQPNLHHWATRTLDRVYEVGFKGLGAWCHPVFHDAGVPMARDLNLWMWVPPKHKRLYDPQWRVVVEDAVRQQAAPLRDNANLIGFYTDNELDWGDGSSGPGVYFDHLPVDDPNRAEVVKVITALWPTVEAFNADWGTAVTSLDELATLPKDHPRAYHRLYSAFLEHLAGDYFRVTSELVRKHAPNHLVLGVRFRGSAPVEVVRASRGHTDAQSINYYPADARLDPAMFRMLHEESGGQPVILSEYAFHALDGRSGNRNTAGFHAQVPDQAARAEGYRLLTTRLARVPYVVSADWFQWMDEPPSGRTSDGEDVNFGIVDVDDRPYDDLVAAIQDTTWRLNDLHAASYTDPQTDVWREPVGDKPVARVPHLATPVALNGNLSDWPADTRLDGMRLAPTVGLDRSRWPLPNVHLGWTDAGLFVGVEVFDHDVVSAPATGWWWTRDCVELFIATRPFTAAEPTAGYDPFCHQFFFVPLAFPDETGQSGTVGQWHRPGDALAASRVPHELVTEAVRVLPDRYVVEMFIPANVLNGFDPRGHPRLAMNVHVRNFQHATEYFWSAPKEQLTQLRPATWGTVHLLPPTTGTEPPAPPNDLAAVQEAAAR